MAADPKPVLELGWWDVASSQQRMDAALAVAKALPESFELDRLATHSLGGQSREIACFRVEGRDFALVPGSPAALLGYDRSQPFQPTDAQRQDWQLTEDEFSVSIGEYLDQYLTQLRRVAIPPLLVEVTARASRYGQDGSDQTEGYERILRECGDGFRLPVPDEWEYICAAGTRSLFRWGDDCPISNSDDEKDWDLHKRANAFGVKMNASTYECELCAGARHRGGDGGGSVCGGMGNVATWLPFASSFQVPDDEIDGWYIDEVMVRRVREIDLAASPARGWRRRLRWPARR